MTRRDLMTSERSLIALTTFSFAIVFASVAAEVALIRSDLREARRG